MFASNQLENLSTRNNSEKLIYLLVPKPLNKRGKGPITCKKQDRQENNRDYYPAGAPDIVQYLIANGGYNQDGRRRHPA